MCQGVLVIQLDVIENIIHKHEVDSTELLCRANAVHWRAVEFYMLRAAFYGIDVNYTNIQTNLANKMRKQHTDRLSSSCNGTRHGAGKKLVFGCRRHQRSSSLAWPGDMKQDGDWTAQWPLGCRSAIINHGWVWPTKAVIRGPWIGQDGRRLLHKEMITGDITYSIDDRRCS